MILSVSYDPDASDTILPCLAMFYPLPLALSRPAASVWVRPLEGKREMPEPTVYYNPCPNPILHIWKEGDL